MNDTLDQQPTEVVLDDKPFKKELSLAARLQKHEQKIVKLRASITNSMFEIANELAAAKALLPRGQVKAFGVYNCGMDMSDVTTLVSLDQKLGGHREVCKQAGINMAGLKALIRADDHVQKQVLGTLKLGTRLNASAINRLNKEAKRASEPAEVQFARERKAAFGAATRQASAKLMQSLTAKAAELFDAMTPDFGSDLGQAMSIEQRDQITALATETLALFAKAVDVDSLPEAWERQGSQSQEARLGRAHDALQALSKGEFHDVDEDGRLYDEEYSIELVLYRAAAWLAGEADSLTVERPTSKSQSKTLRLEPEQDLVVLEICAGGGGQKLGLNAAGFKTIAAYEFEADAIATLSKHSTSLHPRIHRADIRQVDFTRYRGKVDLLAGGVPCQPFSEAGYRRGEADERDLFRETIRILDEVQPRAFFFENVSGFANRNTASYRRKLRKAYTDMGYDSQIFHFYGADYGLGQGRPRVAVIGFRDDLMKHFRMPALTPRRSQGLVDAIGDLVQANGWKGYDEWAQTANRIAPTIIGGSRSSSQYSYSSNFTHETWAGLGIDSTGLSETAPAADHEGLFKMTLQMGARLQGFPDDYEFAGSKMLQKVQIANALPPVMAKMVGLAIHSVLTGTQYDYDAALDQAINTPRQRKQKPLDLNSDDEQLERFFFKETRHLNRDDEAHAEFLESVPFDDAEGWAAPSGKEALGKRWRRNAKTRREEESTT